MFPLLKGFFIKKDASLDNFDNLINEINSLSNNAEVQELFVLSSAYSLVGFQKEESKIGQAGQTCSSFKFSEEIEKPSDCNFENGCLCLCTGKKPSTFNCSPENKAICIGLNYNIVNTKDNCGYLVIEGDSQNNLKIKKSADTLIITF